MKDGAAVTLPEVVVPKRRAPAWAAYVSSPADFIATIKAKGQIYSSWESVMVRRDFHNGISIFEFTPAEGSYGVRFADMKLQPGDPVEISLGGHKVITGAVTARTAAYDQDSHTLVVAGKSLTMDLKDSSVVVKAGNFDGNTFEQAARAVMQPHQSQLVMLNPPQIASKPFPNLSVQYGETVAEFITRLANMRGLIITDDENGNLVAGQGDPNAAPVAELYEGRNILRAVGRLNDETAWSKYSVVGQHPGSDDDYPARSISASVTNSTARPSRFKLMIAEHPGDAEDMAQRANHEMVRSMWPVVDCTITVAGWIRADGELWKPTENVSVYSPMIFPTQTGLLKMGIQSCTYAQDSENGTTTTMELRLPWALTTQMDSGVPDTGGAGGEASKTLAQPDFSAAAPDASDISI